MAEKLKKILIIKPSALGDIVLALPALSALKNKFPDAKISWLIRPEFADILRGHPCVDNIILFDRKYLARAFYDISAFKALIRLIKELRKERFDAVFDFQGLFRTAGLGFLTGCKNRYGMADTREFAYIFYTKKIVRRRQDIHVVDQYMQMVKAAGAGDSEAVFHIPENQAADEAVTRLLTKHNVSGGYAVFIPGSAHIQKCWPVEKFAQLAKKISVTYGLQIVCAGAKNEKKLADDIKSIEAEVVNLAGLTTLPELISLLRKAKIVISNDTGPGHIAAALDTPTVLIFGYSNPARVRPYNKENSFVAIAPFARGYRPDNFDSKYHVSNITVEDVFEKVSLLLKIWG